jgi:hypothetical protein
MFRADRCGPDRQPGGVRTDHPRALYISHRRRRSPRAAPTDVVPNDRLTTLKAALLPNGVRVSEPKTWSNGSFNAATVTVDDGHGAAENDALVTWRCRPRRSIDAARARYWPTARRSLSGASRSTPTSPPAWCRPGRAAPPRRRTDHADGLQRAGREGRAEDPHEPSYSPADLLRALAREPRCTPPRHSAPPSKPPRTRRN